MAVEPDATEGAERRYFTGPAADPTRYWVSESDLERGQAGGEGLVYRAHHTASGREVALKLLTSASVAEFAQISERAELFTGLDHPNLMEQIETFLGTPLTEEQGAHLPAEEFDVPFSVAEWIDGTPLVEAAVDASARQRLAWIADVAAAVSYLHGVRSDATPHGIVHRDIKPSNVRVDERGRAVLLDLGVARAVDHDDMTEGVGTYLWRAPEVLTGSATAGAPSDAWGVGALAHWLLVGEPPNLDGSAAARDRIVRSKVDVGDLAAVGQHVADLLQSSPADRPADLQRWGLRLTRIGRRRFRRDRAIRVAAIGLVPLIVAAVVWADPAGWRDVEAATGHPFLLARKEATLADQLVDATNIAFLAYELAGSRAPSLVRIAATQVLQGGNPCSDFAECKALLEDSKSIRYVGRTRPSPVVLDRTYSYSQAAHLVPLVDLTPPAQPSIDAAPLLANEGSAAPDGATTDRLGRRPSGRVFPLDLYDRRTDPVELAQLARANCELADNWWGQCAELGEVLQTRLAFALQERERDEARDGRPFGYGSRTLSTAPLTVVLSSSCWTETVSDAERAQLFDTMREAVDAINDADGAGENLVSFEPPTRVGLVTPDETGQPIDAQRVAEAFGLPPADVMLNPIGGAFGCVIERRDQDTVAVDEGDGLNEFRPVLDFYLGGVNGDALTDGTIKDGKYASAQYQQFNEQIGQPIDFVPGTLVLLSNRSMKSIETARRTLFYNQLLDTFEEIGGADIVVDDCEGEPEPDLGGTVAQAVDAIALSPLPTFRQSCSRSENAVLDAVGLATPAARRSMWVVRRSTLDEALRDVRKMAELPIDLTQVVLVVEPKP